VNRSAPGTLLRILLPALAGVAVGVVLQLTEPRVRLYAAIAPALLAVILGLVATAALVVRVVVKQRMATAVAAAEAAASGRAAAQAAQDRLRFLARLDHELKNPLTAMRAGLANVDQALGRPVAVDGARTALTSVSGQADRITRLVSDLRRLADLEALQIEMAPVDLSRLLGEVAEASAGLPGAADRSIRASVPQAPWPLPLVGGDRDLLFVAVQNLVANAVKYSRPGDTLEIRASEDGDAVLVEVADTGIGIPPDEVGQVWEELARGRAARAIPGTGIGLALVRVIVARHGGRVAIRSREGQGTVVSVWLPVPGRSRTASAVADLRQRRDTHGETAL
jgi:two-component system, OmpR family, sensor kinase